jgi:hypothetical protein
LQLNRSINKKKNRDNSELTVLQSLLFKSSAQIPSVYSGPHVPVKNIGIDTSTMRHQHIAEYMVYFIPRAGSWQICKQACSQIIIRKWILFTILIKKIFLPYVIMFVTASWTAAANLIFTNCLFLYPLRTSDGKLMVILKQYSSRNIEKTHLNKITWIVMGLW